MDNVIKVVGIVLTFIGVSNFKDMVEYIQNHWVLIPVASIIVCIVIYLIITEGCKLTYKSFDALAGTKLKREGYGFFKYLLVALLLLSLLFAGSLLVPLVLKAHKGILYYTCQYMSMLSSGILTIIVTTGYLFHDENWSFALARYKWASMTLILTCLVPVMVLIVIC